MRLGRELPRKYFGIYGVIFLRYNRIIIVERGEKSYGYFIMKGRYLGILEYRKADSSCKWH